MDWLAQQAKKFIRNPSSYLGGWGILVTLAVLVILALSYIAWAIATGRIDFSPEFNQN